MMTARQTTFGTVYVKVDDNDRIHSDLRGQAYMAGDEFTRAFRRITRPGIEVRLPIHADIWFWDRIKAEVWQTVG